MKAVCPGPSECSTNSVQCMVSPLVEECQEDNYLDGLAQKICNTTHGPDCPALERVTVFRHGHGYGDAVIPPNRDFYHHTAQDNKNPIQTGGKEENTYYALCVECNTCQGWQ